MIIGFSALSKQLKVNNLVLISHSQWSIVCILLFYINFQVFNQSLRPERLKKETCFNINIPGFIRKFIQQKFIQCTIFTPTKFQRNVRSICF